jgi:hypothetical protein
LQGKNAVIQTGTCPQTERRSTSAKTEKDNEQIFPDEMGEALKEMARLRYGYGRTAPPTTARGEESAHAKENRRAI